MKWIISDIDGCLSPEESVAWDLDRFHAFAGICRDACAGRNALPPLTLCTGRPQPYTEVLAKILDIRAPIICENGALIYTLADNRSRYGPGVTPEKIAGLRTVRNYIDTVILPEFPEALYQFGKDAQMSLFSEEPGCFPAIKSRVEAFIADNNGPQMIIEPSHYYLNFSLKNVNKGRALEFLLGELGADRSECAGIGDTEGDMPLRAVTGFFACPANAKPALKAAADYVSPLPDLEGVLDILKRPELRRD
jgi:hydroxymethylpyrimidine pyrophosphatase-like HAD family hydrolase